ncbi:MAG: hypothetical protein KAT30_06195, partial [Candidatus Krumholzibacteria bacterium]|nr:hypothetical protein [Candidatus Krumholzibacteria bacterium]
MRVLIFCGLICLALLSLSISITFSKTWYIKPDGSGDAPTIQAGVDSSAAGDTVLVAEGTYSDHTEVLVRGILTQVNVYIYKNIKLIAHS